MNWIYTNVLHNPRKVLGISVLEYCVLDYVYKTQTHPEYGVNGWAKTGCHKIADFLGVSSGTVKGIFDRMDMAGLLERMGDDLKRVTAKFYSIAYEQDVQKLNRGCSETERGGVQKLNGKRSETEQYINKETKVLNKIEKKVVEKEFSTVLIDADEELVMEIHHVPDYFDTEQKKERKSVAAKKKETPADLQIVTDVVNYLNEKTNRTDPAQQFKATTKETIQFIRSRVSLEKWEFEHFKLVIDFKVSEWLNDDKMRQHLNPSTLFRAANAEKYLLAAKDWKERPVKVKPGIVPLFRQENYQNMDKSKFKF
jgi:uncharacterized phage protein (TIGR02220 family)